MESLTARVKVGWGCGGSYSVVLIDRDAKKHHSSRLTTPPPSNVAARYANAQNLHDTLLDIESRTKDQADKQRQRRTSELDGTRPRRLPAPCIAAAPRPIS